MADFRFEGTTAAGRSARGVISASSSGEAKQKIQELAKKHQVKIVRIQKRKTFIYKVKNAQDVVIKGEQKAFTKDEVERALETLGYTIMNIQPKLLDFKLKPPTSEIVTFVRVSADMLREKLPYNEVLQLLVNDIQNASLRDSVKEIYNDLRQGKDSEEAFIKQEKILGKFTARMLGLASKSGNMTEIYDSTAKFLERNAEFNKSLRSALITPFFTMLVLLGAVVFYVAYIFPETAQLFLKLGMDLPPMTAFTLELSNFLVDNIWMLMVAGTAPLVAAVYFFRSPKGRFLFDKYIISLPIIGTLIHKVAIEIFCRVFYALYTGSGENIDALKLASEACGNKYIEHQVKSIAVPLMLSKGTGLVQAFEATGVFTKTALARFHSGTETGTVRKSALQIANYYEKETEYKLKNAIEFIQLMIAMVITIIITLLTLISSETAVMTPQSPTT
ncbi:MAG: type II secretion system F family protein [Calditrichia bacterium]